MKKVAYILSGCGFLDGAEIRESVIGLLALSEAGAKVSAFAPNKKQHHTIDHTKSEETAEDRNVLTESARIARGEIQPLTELNPNDFDALVIPGGFGVAKNLCDFAFNGSSGEVDGDIRRVIEVFFDSKKPIGAFCIAPALIALVLGKHGVSLTIGEDEATAIELEKTGAKHINCTVDKAIIDKENKIVTTPAYMYSELELKDLYKGIKDCVNSTLALCD